MDRNQPLNDHVTVFDDFWCLMEELLQNLYMLKTFLIGEWSIITHTHTEMGMSITFVHSIQKKQIKLKTKLYKNLPIWDEKSCDTETFLKNKYDSQRIIQ